MGIGIGQALRHIRDRGLKDVLDPSVREAYSEWKEIEKNGIILEAEDIQSFSEQIVYRLSRCSPCVNNGECLHCHCSMPEKALTPLAKCSDGKWPAMLPKEDWNRYKEENNIELIAVQP